MVTGRQFGMATGDVVGSGTGYSAGRRHLYAAAKRAGGSEDTQAVMRRLRMHIGEIIHRPIIWIALAGSILMALAVFMPWVHVSGGEQIEAMVERTMGWAGGSASINLGDSMSLVGVSSAAGDVDGLIAALQKGAQKLGWTIDERPHMPWQLKWAWLIAVLMAAGSALAVVLPFAGLRLGVRIGVLVLGVLVLRGGVAAVRSAAQQDGTRKLIGVARWMISRYESGARDRDGSGAQSGRSTDEFGPGLSQQPKARPGCGPYLLIIGSLVVVAGSVWEVVGERKRPGGNR